MIAFVITLVTSSCYTRTEGCLDLLANNYDVSADDGCETCCVFPSIVIDITHEVNGVKYRADSLLKNDLDQYYLISDVRFYISDFELTKLDNSKPTIIEQICTSDKTYCPADDVKLIRATTPQIKIGTVKNYGDFKDFGFFLGLDTNFTNKTFVGLPNTHPLAKASKLVNANGAFIDFSFNVSKFKILTDTTRMLEKTDNYRLSLGGQPIPFAKGQSLTTRKGENINFALKIDYGSLLQGINLDSSATYNSPFVLKNLPNILE